MLTFTDALLHPERDTGHSLRNRNAIVAVAGAAVGDVIPVVRTAWTISRRGLTSMLGRNVIILNEVAAQAWAAMDSPLEIFAMKGVQTPKLGPQSRHLFITVDEGVGAAVIDIDQNGNVTILEAEGGHLDFAPSSGVQHILLDSLSIKYPVSYEDILNSLGHRCDSTRTISGVDSQLSNLRAKILGQMVLNLILATGAWQGAIMSGAPIKRLTDAEQEAFESAFKERKLFRRLIRAVQCWNVEQEEPVLAGASTLMRHMKSLRLATGDNVSDPIVAHH